MSEAVIKKAKVLQVFLKDSRGMLTFKNCDYLFDENDATLIVTDPNQGEVTLPKAMIGEVYLGETSNCELRLLNP